MAKKKRRKVVRKAGKKREAPVISLKEVERLESEIRQEKAYLRGMDEVSEEVDLPHSRGARPVDASAIRARIRRKEKALEKLSPKSRKLTGRAANRALAEMKEDEAYLRDNLLSTWDMGAFPKADDMEKDHQYRMATEKSIKQEVGNPETQMRAARYKRNARLIDPDDPELCNIERFRSRHKN